LKYDDCAVVLATVTVGKDDQELSIPGRMSVSVRDASIVCLICLIVGLFRFSAQRSSEHGGEGIFRPFQVVNVPNDRGHVVCVEVSFIGDGAFVFD
jgi:hypothetical protein